MQKSLFSMAVAALLLQASVASAQSGGVIDLRNLKPRELRSAVFTLTAPQSVRVEAVGSESQHEGGTFSWVTAIWNGKEKSDDRRDPWMGNAWILDLKSRRVVWELSGSATERGRRSTRTFDGTVRLPAGTYEAFYAAFPNWYWAGEDGDTNAGQRLLNWLHDAGFEDFRLTIHADHRPLAGAEAERARRDFENGAVVTLRGDGGERFQQAGFILSRPTQVEIYAAGEAREDAEFDSGWIINADTRERVWKLTWRDSDAAGGAQKNRMARIAKTLPAGRYAAFYATDDSHDPSQWNTQPPHDPDAWGLRITVKDSADLAAVKPFAYEHVPAASTIVALTGIGDSDTRKQGFTLTRPMDVRIYALGEGRGGRMYDYGWITAAGSRARVWDMTYDTTEPAGGDRKNRLVDTTVHLQTGSYVLHYLSDDSHSSAEWNAAAPADGHHWGITLLAAAGPLDRSAIAPYEEKPDPSILAQAVGIRDDDRVQKRFSLERAADVKVYAVGEASGREMADYGWIEDAQGHRVWEMTYKSTQHAGGASKNRRFEGTIHLPPGQYIVGYETDDSHAFGDWNADPPDDPEGWGITVSRMK